MKGTTLKKTLLAVTTSVIFGTAGIAFADYVDEIEVIGKASVDVKSVKVTFGDLNTGNKQGAEALYRRLQQASRVVCDVAGSRKTRLPDMTAEAKRCYQTALSESVERLDQTLVTGIHEGR